MPVEHVAYNNDYSLTRPENEPAGQSRLDGWSVQASPAGPRRLVRQLDWGQRFASRFTQCRQALSAKNFCCVSCLRSKSTNQRIQQQRAVRFNARHQKFSESFGAIVDRFRVSGLNDRDTAFKTLRNDIRLLVRDDPRLQKHSYPQAETLMLKSRLDVELSKLDPGERDRLLFNLLQEEQELESHSFSFMRHSNDLRMLKTMITAIRYRINEMPNPELIVHADCADAIGEEKQLSVLREMDRRLLTVGDTDDELQEAFVRMANRYSGEWLAKAVDLHAEDIPDSWDPHLIEGLDELKQKLLKTPRDDIQVSPQELEVISQAESLREEAQSAWVRTDQALRDIERGISVLERVLPGSSRLQWLRSELEPLRARFTELKEQYPDRVRSFKPDDSHGKRLEALKQRLDAGFVPPEPRLEFRHLTTSRLEKWQARSRELATLLDDLKPLHHDVIELHMTVRPRSYEQHGRDWLMERH